MFSGLYNWNSDLTLLLKLKENEPWLKKYVARTPLPKIVIVIIFYPNNLRVICTIYFRNSLSISLLWTIQKKTKIAGLL